MDMMETHSIVKGIHIIKEILTHKAPMVRAIHTLKVNHQTTHNRLLDLKATIHRTIRCSEVDNFEFIILINFCYYKNIIINISMEGNWV